MPRHTCCDTIHCGTALSLLAKYNNLHRAQHKVGAKVISADLIIPK